MVEEARGKSNELRKRNVFKRRQSVNKLERKRKRRIWKKKSQKRNAKENKWSKLSD